jgi:prepilin-type N-terminal cleavage/methylation domain-containing protein/prepilin-type processing-associated H-X9-DG protein
MSNPASQNGGEKMKTAKNSQAPPHQTGGFTLIELLVVIAVIGILTALLLAALGKAKSRAQTLTCLNNLKQLELCCHLYSADFDDFLVPNQAGGIVPEPMSTNAFQPVTNIQSWCPGIAPHDATTAGIESGLLFVYNKSPRIYHCPADHSTVDGWPGLLRSRSYCMEISMNCDALDGSYRKFTEITEPPPSDLFVLIDTKEEAIQDATFGIFSPDSDWEDYWLDLAADRHNCGANLTFADGHAESWHWQAPKIFSGLWWPASSDGDLEDLHRLQQHVKPGVN